MSNARGTAGNPRTVPSAPDPVFTVSGISLGFPVCDIPGRKLTKMHEEIIAGSITEICARIDTVREQGEFAIAQYIRELKKAG